MHCPRQTFLVFFKGGIKAIFWIFLYSSLNMSVAYKHSQEGYLITCHVLLAIRDRFKGSCDRHMFSVFTSEMTFMFHFYIFTSHNE